MSSGVRLSAFIVCVCALFGCSKDAASPPPAVDAPAATSPAAASSPSRVVGKVAAPPGGVPVVIVLDPKDVTDMPRQTEKPALDQVSTTFVPPMLFVRTNQPTNFLNNDDTLHNVHVTHVETREPQFNVAIPTGEKYEFTFKRDGFYHVGCDIHPAMSAEIFASASPYVTVAGSDGSFAFDDVPPGAYAVTVYAGAKTTRKDVQIKSGTTEIAL